MWFAVLAIGALVRIDRLSQQTAVRDERFLTLGQCASEYPSSAFVPTSPS